MNKQRNSSYDLLRIISCIAVILIHVNYESFGKIAFEPSFTPEWIFGCLVNVFTRFCVPCFVMISGAFILNDERNGELSYFYRKRFLSEAVPALIIGLLIFIVAEVQELFGGHAFFFHVKTLIEGSFFNFWYVYMIMGLYLLTPFIIRLKKTVSEKTYAYLAFAMLGWAIISQATTNYRFPYSIGVVFSFVSYYLLGDVIRNKARGKASVYFLGYLLFFAATFAVRLLGYNNVKFVSDAYTNFFAPLIALGSLCLFAFFGRLKLTKDFHKVGRYTYYVYLFHTFVYRQLIGLFVNMNSIISTLAVSVLTFLISLILAVLFDRLYRPLRKKLEKAI